MDPGLETDGSVRPQGGARVRTRVERLPSRLCAVAGARQSEGWGLQVFGEGSAAGLNGGASEGPGGFPEAQLPVPGCPLRPLAGPREPGTVEVLLPYREDDRQAARLEAGPLGKEDSLSRLLFPPPPGRDLHTAPETLQGTALDSTDLLNMPAQPTVPQ